MGAGEDILKKLDLIIMLQCRGPRGQVASDGELNSAKGDSEVKFEPRDWRGDPQKGLRFSQCDTAFLDLFAEMMDDDSDMPRKGKEEFAGLNRRSARLARGWAKRIRANGGQKAKPAAAPGGYGSSSGYGTTGYGASAKHTGTPEPADDFGSDYGGGGGGYGGDSDIPFTYHDVPAV